MNRTSTRVSFSIAIGGLIIAMTALLSACGDEKPEEYVFYSGGEGGVYYPTAQLIAQLANAANNDFSLRAVTSGGSAENARKLGDASADFALIQSDIAAYAREGSLDFEEPVPEILGLAALYPEHVQIVTLADTGIDSLLDLAGKTVAIGAQGSGTEENARQILDAAGLTTADLLQVAHLSAGDSVDALAAGEVDAAFFTFGLGTPAIEELASQRAITFVPVDGEVRQRLLGEYAFYREGSVSAASYTGVERDVPTVSVAATLVAREGVPDGVVEATLGAIFEHLDAFAGGRLADMTVESARDGLSLPLHPGATKFYASQ